MKPKQHEGRGGPRPGAGRKKLDIFTRLAQAATLGTGLRLTPAETFAIAGRVERRERRCLKCLGAGKIDRGNGTTKPCTCSAGESESERLRALARMKQ